MLLARTSWTCSRLTTAKACVKDVFIDQERKLEDRRRSDTVLVTKEHIEDRLGKSDIPAFQIGDEPGDRRGHGVGRVRGSAGQGWRERERERERESDRA